MGCIIYSAPLQQQRSLRTVALFRRGLSGKRALRFSFLRSSLVTRARALVDRLRLPVIAAPMFLVSGPALVIAASRAGVLGTFPALNQRSTEGFRAWLDEIEAG